MLLCGVVIEGVSGSGKSTLLTKLHRHMAQKCPAITKLNISEHYTERVLEDMKASGSLTGEAIAKHSRSQMAVIESIVALRVGSKFTDRRGGNAAIMVTIERWLGTHVANLAQLGTGTDPGIEVELKAMTSRLSELGLVFVVLELPRAVLQERLEVTYSERNDGWRRYIDGLGGPDRAGDYYWRWQESLIDFYVRNGLPVDRYQVNGSSNPFARLVEQLDRQLAS